MPRKKAQAVEPVVETQAVEQPEVEQKPIALTKADYIKARATIQQYREEKKNRPKRPCSERQLAALKAGREKNKKFAKKKVEENK